MAGIKESSENTLSQVYVNSYHYVQCILEYALGTKLFLIDYI